MRSIAVAPLLLFVLVTGCAAPPASVSEGLPPPEARTPVLTFADCDSSEGAFAIPRDVAQAMLPAPLVAAENADPSLAMFYVTSLDCAAGTRDGVAMDAVRIAWAGIMVEPPGGFREEEIDFHGHLLGSVHTVAASAEGFSALGQAQATQGEVGFDTTLTPATRASTLTAAGMTLLTQTDNDGGGIEKLDARFYAVEDGEVTGALRFAVRDHGIDLGAAQLEAREGVFGHDPAPILTSYGIQGLLKEITADWLPRAP